MCLTFTKAIYKSYQNTITNIEGRAKRGWGQRLLFYSITKTLVALI